MPADPTITLEDLLKAAAAFALAHYARHARRLTLTLEGGEELSIPVPGPAPPPPAHKLNETEQTIVLAIGADTELAGAEIAARTGYTFDGWFREQLASMRRRGILTGEARSAGYGVSPGYAPAVS